MHWNGFAFFIRIRKIRLSAFIESSQIFNPKVDEVDSGKVEHSAKVDDLAPGGPDISE